MITATDTLNVLLIEDDEDDYLITRSLLSKAQVIDCDLEWMSSYEEGLEAVLSNQYDACLVDYRLGAKTGLDLLQEAKAHGCRTPIILLTGQGDLKVDIEAMEAGAADYLNKNEIDAPLLERSLRYARERGEAEERIRKQAALLDKARDAIIAYDMDGRVIYWNKSAERLTGWSKEEMLGEKARERLYEHDQNGVLGDCWETMMASGEWKGELHQQTKGGDEIVVESRWTLVRETDGTPESVLVINTDITERKRLESQFLRSQRMESIGRLVSGIAHDLGNLLVPISLGVKVLQQRFSDDEKASRTLSVIQNSAERGSDMVDQVLAFARGVEGERVALQLGTIIDDVQNITEETFPEEVDVDVDVEEDLQQIVGDATQIQQVLMNLCVNARDAMPEGGTLTVRAENVTLDQSDARMNIDAEPGAYVCVTVSDTGVGMPEEVADKIFEPFFSTKPEGEGTGLGLSTAYSIVKGHDGFIEVQSEEGVGTTFRIFWPVSQAEAKPVDDSASGELRDGKGARVLVVDDEENILNTAKDALEQAGYRVETAQGGGEVLQQLRAHQLDVDVVITDIVMPDPDGLAVIERLRAERPEVPIIAASGLADERTDKALAAGAEEFLSKPFTAEKLQSALQRVLRLNDEPAASSR
ncbi:MAG: response regulator [Bacteroidetes bacterium]|jgi:PAS domain S-box-containing protein|nr:response regulator [Bacteroidota bacterium]